MKIEVGQIWETEDGPRRIICTDALGSFPIVSAALSESCTSYVCTHTADGFVFKGGHRHRCDLIAEHREPMKRTLWLVIAPTGHETAEKNEHEAQRLVSEFGGTIHRGTWTEETP